jgi:hypothetical protein
MMDGGRLQIRDRKPSIEEKKEEKDEQPQQPKKKKEKEKAGFWCEDKVGCLMSMTSKVSTEDPCPEIPPVFLDHAHMRKISREIKGFCHSDQGESKESLRDKVASSPRDGQPEVLVRSVVATRENVHVFGNLLAAAAWRRGFAAAPRKAFVGDGQEANWNVWRRHFSHYTAILDFIHAICYVYAAAMTGRSSTKAWPIYCEWAQWLWSGRVDLVIAALRLRQAELDLPEKDESEETPRSKVAITLRYLENQQSRMGYAEYRRLGLPITSCYVESTIKQVNRRLKGTEKFWSNGGAEALLQLAADYLSETDPLTTFWKDRPNRATGQRHYQTSG